MKCKVKDALALANSMILSGERMTAKAEKVIYSALRSRCTFQEIAEDYLELYNEGALCCDCRNGGKRETEACRVGPEGDDLCGIWGLAEKARMPPNRYLWRKRGTTQP